MIYSCPFCRTMFEMGGDHGAEPCARCFSNGYRIDSCGNRSFPAGDPLRLVPPPLNHPRADQ